MRRIREKRRRSPRKETDIRQGCLEDGQPALRRTAVRLSRGWPKSGLGLVVRESRFGDYKWRTMWRCCLRLRPSRCTRSWNVSNVAAGVVRNRWPTSCRLGKWWENAIRWRQAWWSSRGTVGWWTCCRLLSGSVSLPSRGAACPRFFNLQVRDYRMSHFSQHFVVGRDLGCHFVTPPLRHSATVLDNPLPSRARQRQEARLGTACHRQLARCGGSSGRPIAFRNGQDAEPHAGDAAQMGGSVRAETGR